MTLLKPQQDFRSFLISCSLQSQIYALKRFQADWKQVNNRQTFDDRQFIDTNYAFL